MNKMKNIMDLSVIIVNHNERKLLRDCLASIFENTKGIEFEVILIDNNSWDGSCDMVESEYPQIFIIKNNYNAGFTKANNQGLRRAKGRYLLLLNNDTVVLNEALDKAVEFMDQHLEAGAVGCKLLNPDGTVQMTGRSFPTYKTAFFNRSSLLTKLFPNNKFSREYLLSDWDHNSMREVDWVSGACLMVRRETMNKVGLLDEEFFIYCEDTDWCYRIKERGWKVYLIPQVQIVHYSGKGGSGRHRLRMVIEHHRSMYHFYKKHYKKKFPWNWLTIAGIAARATFLMMKNVLAGKHKVIKAERGQGSKK